MQEPLVVLDRGFTVVNANPAFFKTFKTERDETLGQCLFDLGNGQWDIPELRELLAEVVPKATAIIGYEVTHDFPVIGQRTMLVTARRLAHPDENGSHLLLVFEDATDRRRADSDKDILLAETRHRMKNLFAVLRAVATQTKIEGRTAEQYRDIFLGRFEAVINAHTFISEHGSDADLSALVEQILRPFAGPRADVSPSPPVALLQHQILPLAMMLNELATNAAKYGALSNAVGVIHLGWEIRDHDGKRSVVLEWREEGGPAVSPPSREGFGTNLIRQGVKTEGGEAEFDFAPAGLRARLTLPLAH